MHKKKIKALLLFFCFKLFITFQNFVKRLSKNVCFVKRQSRSAYAKLFSYKRLWYIVFNILQTSSLLSMVSATLFFLMSCTFLKSGF